MVKNQVTPDWSQFEGRSSGRFRPRPYYDPDTDSVTVYISDAESRRERIDKYLTVYRSLETNEITGCHVKYVRIVLKTVQGFDIGIKTKSVKLGLLLLGLPMTEQPSQSDEDLVIHYRRYREVLPRLSSKVGSVNVEVPELCGSSA